jgi:hypothetical protein
LSALVPGSVATAAHPVKWWLLAATTVLMINRSREVRNVQVWSTPGQGADRAKRFETELLRQPEVTLTCKRLVSGLQRSSLTRKRSEVQIL